MHRRPEHLITCLPTLFELDKSSQFESGVTCIKETDAGLLLIDLVNTLLERYVIKILHQN